MSNFCPLPWIGLEITPVGAIRPCCKYSEEFRGSIVDYYNSDDLRQLKSDFEHNKKSEKCHRCWTDEDSGVVSKRQITNDYIKNNNIEHSTELTILSLPFGNTCNLACRICNGTSSSKWVTEENALRSVLLDIPVNPHVKLYETSLFDAVKSYITSNLRHIDFPGGEPFLVGIPQHMEFLSWLITQGFSNQITLHYTTNCTIFPKEVFWEYWKNFKSVEIQLSIDGIENHFEYIRWPANWISCLNNIRSMNQRIKNTTNMSLSISHTVSIFNVFYLPQFLEWAKSESLPAPYTGIAYNKKIYSFMCLSEESRQALSEVPNMPEYVKPYLKLHYDEEFLLKSLHYLKVIDERRGQRFSEYFPEYYALLVKTDPRWKGL